jgi:uncharacterized small protein (DUF1192 family)
MNHKLTGEAVARALATRLGKDIDLLTVEEIHHEAARLRAESQAHFEHAAEIRKYVEMRKAGLIA